MDSNANQGEHLFEHQPYATPQIELISMPQPISLLESFSLEATFTDFEEDDEF